MRCYFLALVSGSSLDQQSNNVTLFNLVEQLNFPPSKQPPPGALLPIEIHAYFQLYQQEVNQRFDVRFAIVESSGLETVTEPFQHKSSTQRYPHAHAWIAGTARARQLSAARRFQARGQRGVGARRSLLAPARGAHRAASPGHALAQ